MYYPAALFLEHLTESFLFFRTQRRWMGFSAVAPPNLLRYNGNRIFFAESPLRGKESDGMAYPDDHTLQSWLDALGSLNVRVKKMFGCYCLYCDDQAVGWLSGTTLSLREVGLTGLPAGLHRPGPGDKIQEIPIPLECCSQDWLPRAVQQTALRRREQTPK